MSETGTYLAFDLGAESGRGVLGTLNEEKLILEDVHRFPNQPVKIQDGLHWDLLGLFHELTYSLRLLATERETTVLDGIGVDTWGVDYGLLGKNDLLLGNPYHYRDDRTDGMLDRALGIVSREEIFEATGIQFMQFNTLYQLVSMVEQEHPFLDSAETFLMIPDLLNFFLTGRKAVEFSNATTTQAFDPRAGDWARDLLGKLGVPTEMFPEVIQPGTILGDLSSRVCEQTQMERAPVIAPATHDTGSAVAAVPASGDDWCYISSGTWSLMGVEAPSPLISEDALKFNFTNEGGIGGTTRFLKNIMGLWLVQECKRTWERRGEALNYDRITRLASEAPPFVSVINPDDPSFLKPGDMPKMIQQFCHRTGQGEPIAKGAIVRCALEALALRYRWVLESMEELFQKRFNTIHIVGGGTKNALLCQFAADATGRTVVAGPVEATAIGNILVQALATGQLSSIEEGRAIVRNSFPMKEYTPEKREGWDDAYEKFKTFL